VPADVNVAPADGAADGAPCLPTWPVIGESCYYVSSASEYADWDLARSLCLAAGADLAIVNSAAETTAVASLLDSQGVIEVWLGLTDRAVETQWIWVDGSEEPAGFWHAGEPNAATADDDCATLVSDGGGNGTWYDQACPSARQFLCER
jgi:hypothetical protein